ncbi:hypothetical protein BJ138DRAFT_1161315 [Hygrophoropsis aurantiaca]|uniref:Uncharacterized protein n=1 Tax=Hygrophoropsis aurantiaca TaxID=72124 RepID=A0ACB8A1C8_9AGAM|nr:hypothetical protein BJ138DRAFT_1161315 [Hygrophoropsis aurantiaca]
MGGTRHGGRHSTNPRTNTPAGACTPDSVRNGQGSVRATGETLTASLCLASASPSNSVSPTSSPSSTSNALTPPKGYLPSSVTSSIPTKHAPKHTRYSPTSISNLPGTGPYALDSYRIICTAGNTGLRNHEQQERHQEDNAETEAEWKRVVPSDKGLIRYLVCRGHGPF